MTPPTWPQDLLGPVSLDKAEKGRALFVREGCIACHGPHVASKEYTEVVAPGRISNDSPALPLWRIHRVGLDRIGTDPNVSQELVRSRVDLTRMGLDLAEVQRLLRRELEEQKRRQAAAMDALRKKAPADPAPRDLVYFQQAYDASTQQIANLNQLDFRSVSVGEGLNILDMIIRERYYTDRGFSESERACYNGFGMLDLPDVGLGYKPRPLEGVWATPPFLHNGSIPTVYDLLSPASERPERFYVGRREFDARKIGYVTMVVGKNDQKIKAVPGEFLFDTRLPGNSNSGHLFDDGNPPGKIGRTLKPEEREAIVEYLKIHRDDVDVIDYLKNHGGKYPERQPLKMPDCSAQLAGRR